MKKMRELKTVLLVVLIISFNNINSQNKMVESHQMSNYEKTISNEQHQIKLKKGELFLVISSITKADAQEEMNNYFKKVFPIASKHGFKPLANLPIDKVVTGKYMPNNFFGLYTWPNQKAVESFLSELPNSELTPMRLKIWEKLKQVMTVVKAATTLTFYEGKIYEILTLWNEKQLNPKKIEKLNGKIIYSSPVSGYEDLTGGKSPKQIAIIEWSSENEAKAYKHNNYTRNIVESFYTHIQIPEKN